LLVSVYDEIVPPPNGQTDPAGMSLLSGILARRWGLPRGELLYGPERPSALAFPVTAAQ
jgi:hypothetical protein